MKIIRGNKINKPDCFCYALNVTGRKKKETNLNPTVGFTVEDLQCLLSEDDQVEFGRWAMPLEVILHNGKCHFKYEDVATFLAIKNCGRATVWEDNEEKHVRADRGSNTKVATTVS